MIDNGDVVVFVIAVRFVVVSGRGRPTLFFFSGKLLNTFQDRRIITLNVNRWLKFLRNMNSTGMTEKKREFIWLKTNGLICRKPKKNTRFNSLALTDFCIPMAEPRPLFFEPLREWTDEIDGKSWFREDRFWLPFLFCFFAFFRFFDPSSFSESVWPLCKKKKEESNSIS